MYWHAPSLDVHLQFGGVPTVPFGQLCEVPLSDVVSSQTFSWCDFLQHGGWEQEDSGAK
jgi:hypothetical protein